METGATQNEMPHSAFPSAGSVGHPELCRRPCILFKHGACHKGANCEPLPQGGEWWIYTHNVCMCVVICQIKAHHVSMLHVCTTQLRGQRRSKQHANT